MADGSSLDYLPTHPTLFFLHFVFLLSSFMPCPFFLRVYRGGRVFSASFLLLWTTWYWCAQDTAYRLRCLLDGVGRLESFLGVVPSFCFLFFLLRLVAVLASLGLSRPLLPDSVWLSLTPARQLDIRVLRCNLSLGGWVGSLGGFLDLSTRCLFPAVLGGITALLLSIAATILLGNWVFICFYLLVN